MLQTAQAVVYNPSTRQASVRFRLLLDTRSQQSFVTTTHTRHALRIEAEREQKVSVVTFGSEGGHMQSSEVIRVSLKTKHGPDRELELLVVPLICQPLTTQPASRNSNTSHISIWPIPRMVRQ